MASAKSARPPSLMDGIEEFLIAAMLGAMTVITFANVIARYLFNQNILWALETTVFLFAWMVLLGASYAVKKSLHLGVDAVVNLLPVPAQRALALVSAGCCIAFSALLLKGSWDYWANFANLPATTGRWVPTGFETMTPTSFRAWYEVNDIPMPGFLQFLAESMNEGERYEKLPRFIPYAVMPLSMALLLLRFVQATAAVWRGDTSVLIASHEAEEMVEQAAAKARAEER